MKINEIMKERRRHLDMTQSELAEKLDVSDKTVSRWELGISYPNIDMIPKIARVLGLSINELFAGVTPEDEKLNQKEAREYGKITALKIFFFQFAACCVIAATVNIVIVALSLHWAWLLIPYLLTVLSATVFFCDRIYFKSFYSRKFYQSEYKSADSFYTVFALALLFCTVQFFIGIFVVTEYFNCLVPIAVCSVIFALLCFIFNHRLGTKFNLKSVWTVIALTALAAVVVIYFAFGFMQESIGIETVTEELAVAFVTGIVNPITALLGGITVNALVAVSFIINQRKQIV